MSNNVFILGLVFLFMMVFLAGAGIGVVVGFVLGSREDKPAGLPPGRQPANLATPAVVARPAGPALSFSDVLRSEQTGFPSVQAEPAPSMITIAPVPPKARAQSWTVALAVAVMLACALCVLLTAALSTAGR